MDKENISYPFCLSIDRNGFAYCSTHNHCSGLFFMDELLCMKEAIEKTILAYKNEGITDSYIEDEDKKAMEVEFSRINRPQKDARSVIVDDLYLIQDTCTNLLKIGRSKNAESRRKTMQTATGNRLELLFVIKGYGYKELELHDKFAKYRKEGEWFEFSQSIIDEYMSMGGTLLVRTINKEKRFVKPTIQEIQAHILEKGYTFDAEAFYAFYESNGWKVGKNPMKNWKMACTTWQKTRNERNKNNSYGRVKTNTEKFYESIAEANEFSKKLREHIGEPTVICDGDTDEAW